MFSFSSYFYLFSILFHLLIGNNPHFHPGKRFEHTATVVDNKLFILGGFGEREGKEFFYLDVSSPFTTIFQPKWNDLTDMNPLKAHWGATSVNGGANNSSLILYGGIHYKTSIHSNFPLVHIFDAQSNSWSVPEVSGRGLFPLVISGVIDNSGHMYILDTIEYRMVVFDTIDLTLRKKSSININVSMLFYVAVLLPDQNIIYFSDSDRADPNLREVLLYNTNDDRWHVQETIGNIPSDRSDFSAVLALDGQRVIVFGGMTLDSYEPIPGEDALYVLDTKNFEWYIPKVSGNFPSRSDHKANVIGKYMVVTFGLFYYDEDHILLLDISNNDEYIWTTEFTTDKI